MNDGVYQSDLRPYWHINGANIALELVARDMRALTDAGRWAQHALVATGEIIDNPAAKAVSDWVYLVKRGAGAEYYTVPIRRIVADVFGGLTTEDQYREVTRRIHNFVQQIQGFSATRNPEQVRAAVRELIGI